MNKFEYITAKGVLGMFYETLESGDAGYVEKLSMHIDSSSETEKLAWLGAVPMLREMSQGRQIVPLNEYEMDIINKEYEATVEFSDRDLRRDKTGQIQIRIGEFADGVNDHWAELMSIAINNGATQVCYDGQYFFDTDHQEGDSGTHSNKLQVDLSDLPVTESGSATAPSASAMVAGIGQSIQKMYSFTDDRGRPINQMAKSFLVMVPTGMFLPGLSAAISPVIDGGDTNVLKAANAFNIEIVPNPRLTASDTFFVFRTDGRTKPFIRSSETPVETHYLDRNSEFFAQHRKTQLGAFVSRGFGFGRWQHGVSCQFVA